MKNDIGEQMWVVTDVTFPQVKIFFKIKSLFEKQLINKIAAEYVTQSHNRKRAQHEGPENKFQSVLKNHLQEIGDMSTLV